MNETHEIPRRIMLEAHQIAAELPGMLTSRKLTPVFSNFFLTSDGRMILFIAVLDSTRIGDHARYVHPDLLHQLSTDLGGRKVYLSNSTGLRLVIPLSNPPKLPKSIELPGDVPTGDVALGVRLGGRSIFVPWNRLGHLLIAAIGLPPKTDPTFELGLVKGDRKKWQGNTLRRNRSSGNCEKRRC